MTTNNNHDFFGILQKNAAANTASCHEDAAV